MKRYVPAALMIAVSICLITIGILMKQPESVLHKAVRICMECIGLG